ncbi:C39 family peptidase [bacterium]|nr:C39 family peptidase [bacterium]
MCKTLAFSLLLALLVIPNSGFSVDWSDVEEARRARQQAQQELSQTEKAIRSLKAVIASLQQQEAYLEGKIAQLNNQIKQTEAKIEDTKNKIKEEERKLKEQQEILNQAIVLMYEEGDTPVFETLFSGAGFSEVLDRLEYYATVELTIEETIARIEQIKAELEKQKQSLEKEKENLLAQKSSLQDSKVALSTQKQLRLQRLQELEQLKQQQGIKVARLTAREKALYQAWLEAILSNKDAVSRSIDESGKSFYYSQVDPRWSGYYYDSGYTIGGYGCLITSIAMTFKYYGVNETPLSFAKKASFIDGAYIWGSGLHSGMVIYRSLSSFNWSVLDQNLKAGHPVIIKVYNYQYGGISHWMLVYGIKDGKHLVNDPAVSVSRKGYGLALEDLVAMGKYSWPEKMVILRRL